MKRFIWLLAICGLASGFAAAQYAKQGVRLRARIPLADFPGAPTSGAGCAGYVSPSGQEYACMGVRNGTVVVRVTDPANPVQIAHIPGLTSTWHEMTVLNGYLYSVADAVDQGMQIIDLRRADENIVELVDTYHVNSLNRVHTIQANPATNSLFLNGSNRGFVILDATNPAAPVEVARWTTKYVHDAQIVSYASGPYAGREIAFLCCGGSGLYILDITDRANLMVLSNVPYLTGSYYTHSGQLTPDRKYFLINDEFDEKNALVDNCSTHIVDVQDLESPQYKGAFLNPIGVIDHNSQMVGNTMYLAAYRGGVRVYDTTQPLAIFERGYFDTYPLGNGYDYTGAWGTFVFPSGTTIVSDINRGLFVLDPSEAAGLGAPLVAVSASSGQITSGGLASLRTADRDYLRLLWRTGSGGSVARVQVVVEAETTFTPSTWVDVTVAGLPVRPDVAQVTVELYNWGTGAYETAGSYNASKVNPQGGFLGLQGAKFVDATGKIRARLTASPVGPGAETKFAFFFDLLKFTVRSS